MEITKGVTLDYKEGSVVLSAHVSQFVGPVLEDLKSKVESGAIDPVKGTDMDKELLLKALAFLQTQVG